MRGFPPLKMRHCLTTWLVVGLLPVCTDAMTIDIFTAMQGPASDWTSGDGGQMIAMDGPQTGNIVPASGRRELFAEKTNAAMTGRAQLEVNLDALFYTTHSGISGRFDVGYFDLGGVDLSFGDGITVTGQLDASGAAGGGTLLGLYVEDMASQFGRSEVVLASAGNFTHTFAKADFVGVDFNQIDAIRLGSFQAANGTFVDVPAGGDVVVTSLATTAVPEPAMLWLPALLVLGLMMFVLRKRFTDPRSISRSTATQKL